MFRQVRRVLWRWTSAGEFDPRHAGVDVPEDHLDPTPARRPGGGRPRWSRSPSPASPWWSPTPSSGIAGRGWKSPRLRL